MSKPVAAVEYQNRRFEMRRAAGTGVLYVVSDAAGNVLTAPLTSSAAISDMVRRVFGEGPTVSRGR